MNRFVLLVAILVCIAGCQHSPENPALPAAGGSSANPIAKGGAPAGFVLNESGFVAELIAEGLTGPEGFDILGNGVIYAVNNADATIVKITPNGHLSSFAQIPITSQPVALTDLVIEPSRGMFTSVLNDGKIFNVRFNGGGIEYASGLNMPTSIAFDSDRELYVCEIWDNCVTKVNRDGIATTVVQLDDATRPRGILFDTQDRLYVLSSNMLEAKIRRFDIRNYTSFPMTLAQGVHVATIQTVPVNDQVQDITFGFDGDLFAVGRYNVYRVPLSGTSSIFAIGLGGPYNRITVNSRGDLLISDYAQNVIGAGRVIAVSRIHH